MLMFLLFTDHISGGGANWFMGAPPVEKSQTKLIQSSPQSETLIESSFSDFDY